MLTAENIARVNSINKILSNRTLVSLAFSIPPNPSFSRRVYFLYNNNK